MSEPGLIGGIVPPLYQVSCPSIPESETISQVSGTSVFSQVETEQISSDWADPLVLDELAYARKMAEQECACLTGRAMNFVYPVAPSIPFFRIPTAYGMMQWIRLACFNDSRNLAECDVVARRSSLGPMIYAVDRAIARNHNRGVSSAANILVVGAGQRLAEAALKEIFGERISIHESSPTYAALKGAIDFEWPASGIDDAKLPEDKYELVYSFFGNMYGDDQVKILQKLADSTSVGGEIFVMWKYGLPGSRLNRMAYLARRYASMFQAFGLDISVISGVYPGVDSAAGAMHMVWARKRKQTVDVAALFELADEFDRKRPSCDPFPATIRLSTAGPYFLSRDFDKAHLRRIVEGMIASACGVMGIDPIELERKLLFGSPSYCSDKYLERNGLSRGSASLADHILQQRHYDEIELGYPSPIESGDPLSFVALRQILNVMEVLGTEFTRTQMLAKRYSFIAQMKRG